jgi:hypothetical protein
MGTTSFSDLGRAELDPLWDSWADRCRSSRGSDIEAIVRSLVGASPLGDHDLALTPEVTEVAEQFVLDVHGLDEGVIDASRVQIGDRGLVDVLMQAALADVRGRIDATSSERGV